MGWATKNKDKEQESEEEEQKEQKRASKHVECQKILVMIQEFGQSWLEDNQSYLFYLYLL